MKQINILNGIQLRSLFDSFSHEFKSSTVEEKIQTLALLNKYGFLEQTVKEYQKNYKENNRQDIVDDVNKTLDFFVTKLNPKISFKTYGKDKAKLKDIISALKTELEKLTAEKYSVDKLVSSYLDENKTEYEMQKKFFKIDLEKDITKKIKQRDAEENKPFAEQYFHLYKFLQHNLLPDFRNENFAGYMIDMGFDYHSEYVVRFFLENPTKENYFEAIKYAVEVLFFEKEPFHKFVLFRNNFGNKTQIKKFYDKNETAIYLDTDRDFEDWKRIENGENPKQQYLQRWKSLNELLKEEDVIILASYQGIGFKIGKIRKGTKFRKLSDDNFAYYFFKLENAKEVDLDLFPFVQTILPSNVTLSNIYRKHQSLRKIYPRVACFTQNFEMDDKAIEVLVSEWLRSKYAPKEFKIKYQILKTGGNKKDIDIFAVTEDNKKLIGQVSNTKNLATMKQKIKKLEKYEDFQKIFFFNTSETEIENQKVVDVNQVIEDLSKDKFYRELFLELNA